MPRVNDNQLSSQAAAARSYAKGSCAAFMPAAGIDAADEFSRNPAFCSAGGPDLKPIILTVQKLQPIAFLDTALNAVFGTRTRPHPQTVCQYGHLLAGRLIL